MEAVDEGLMESQDVPAVGMETTIREVIEIMQATGAYHLRIEKEGQVVGHLGVVLGADDGVMLMVSADHLRRPLYLMTGVDSWIRLD